MDELSIPCKVCGTPTWTVGTKLCDRCWELKSCIRELDPNNLIKLLNLYRDEIWRYSP